MKLKDIKAMNLKEGQYIEIRYGGEDKNLETRCGWFQGIFELPEGMTEIPVEYKASYPISPPFVEIVHKRDRNHCSRKVVPYLPKNIYWLIKLKPIVEKS